MQDQATESTKHFVWWSTEKSVAEGVPSVLAAVEVVVAVGAYWAIAIYFETTTHLWVSICVAPLLLLRSEQSVALGAKWFDFYVGREFDFLRRRERNELRTRSLSKIKFWGSIATGLIVSALTSYLLAHEWPVGRESWPVPLQSAIIANIAVTVTVAVAVMGARVALFAALAVPAGAAVVVTIVIVATVLGTDGPAAFLVVMLTALTLLIVYMGALISVQLALEEALAILVTGVVVSAGSAALAGGGAEGAAWAVPVTLALFGPSLVVGIWLRTIVIRCVATVYFLRSGFWNIPANFKHALFIVDLHHPPELVPGYSGSFPNASTLIREGKLPHDNFVEFFRDRMREGRLRPRPADTAMHQLFTEMFGDHVDRDLVNLQRWKAFFRGLVVVMGIGLSLPAYVYRLSIKSTCWLYLPLVYVASERDLAVTPAHFVDRVIRGGWEWWRRILAVLTLIAFAATTLASISAQELAGLMHGAISPKIISPLEFMFQFDFSGKWWQYCSLAGALITGLLFLQAKEMRVDIHHAHDAQAQATVARQIDRVKLMMRVRNVLSVALIAMIAIHALLSFSPIGLYLPTYIVRGLGWFYGSYMPPIPTAP